MGAGEAPEVLTPTPESLGSDEGEIIHHTNRRDGATAVNAGREPSDAAVVREHDPAD
jgi:hypothetical protein